MEEYISTGICTALPPENMPQNLLVAPLARSNQSPLDGHNTMATPIFLPEDWELFLANLLLLGHLQVWDHPVSLFDEGIDSGTSMVQNYDNGLDVDVTRSQLAQSHVHLPQINRGSGQEPPLPYNNHAMISVRIIVYLQLASRKLGSIRIDYPLIMSFQACSRPPTESSQGGSSISIEVEPELGISQNELSTAPFRTIRPPAVAPSQRHLPRGTPVAEEKSYDRPGKKPAAPFEPDALKLEESCRQDGGSAFAVDWIIPTFKYGVTAEALLRVLKRKEINEVNFPGGFEPHQAYDGFISKAGGRYECGLCKEGKKTQWKNKKDAPRHLRKFHFGIADVCNAWWVKRWRFSLTGVSNYILIFIYSGKDVFSRAEMKTHRCVRRAENDSQAESGGTR